MLYVSAKGKDGNLQSCFSSLEIIWTIYDTIIPNSKENRGSRFILSKGQSNLALLAVLEAKGLLEEGELDTFCQFDSRVSMQADRTKFNGIIETSAGSLGHGFPMAVGMAWAERIMGRERKVYCLAGDGEMNEGTMWEAALFASSEKLNNLTLIIDHNHSYEGMIDMGDLEVKFQSFGFYVLRVNGHNITEVEAALIAESDKPVVILAETVRGWGSKTLMADRSWFHRYPKNDELSRLLEEVDEFCDNPCKNV